PTITRPTIARRDSTSRANAAISRSATSTAALSAIRPSVKRAQTYPRSRRPRRLSDVVQLAAPERDVELVLGQPPAGLDVDARKRRDHGADHLQPRVARRPDEVEHRRPPVGRERGRAVPLERLAVLRVEAHRDDVDQPDELARHRTLLDEVAVAVGVQAGR